MIMNYEEYSKIVPKETSEYVNFVLKLFDAFMINDNDIEMTNGIISHEGSKIFALLLFAKCHFSNNDRLRMLLDSCDFKKKFINFESIGVGEIDYNDIFNKYFFIFCPFVFYENYMFLTPDRIIAHAIEKNIFYTNSIELLFSNSKWKSILIDNYPEYTKNLEDKLKAEINTEFYKGLSYELIDYLEKTAKIFKYFEKNKANNNTYMYDSSIVETNDDMVLASLILSIYNTNNNVSSFFESIGIKKYECEKYLGVDDRKYFEKPPCSGTILSRYFKKYLDDGLNKEIERENLTVDKVISNIFNRNFTNSLVLEKLLYKYNMSIKDFSDFENKLQNFANDYDFYQKQKRIDDFYKEISQDVIEFVGFVSKLQKAIKDSLENDNKVKKYINSDFDIRVLSFFISSYFVSNDFINYFKDNGITKEKVLEKLGLNINKDDILKNEADVDMIINEYEDIIFGYTTSRKKVNINTILYSLGNSDNTKTNCILKLVKDINPNLRIPDNFASFIINYNENKESLRKYELEQKFFGNMNEECINFLKNVSRVYQVLENSNITTQLSRDDLIEIAICYTAIHYGDKQNDSGIMFLEKLKKHNLYEIGINIQNESYNYHDSIDIIYNYFGKYVFGGKNKDKDKCNITVRDIYTNIFDKNVNDSLALYKFLDDIEFDYHKFNNFEENLLEFEVSEHINDVKSCISSTILCRYFENLSKIYNNLFNMAKSGNLIYDADKDIDSIKDVSKLLSLLLETDNSHLDKYLSLLSKRGITLDNYLKYLNLDKGDFNKFETMNVDYLTIYENFKGYYDYYRYSENSEIVKIMFQKNNNKYAYENFIKDLGWNPDVIAREMETGEEVIVELSAEEQLNYLATIPFGKLDYNLNSILKFGRELADHSIIIANEFVNIAIQDNNNNRVLDIKDEISKLMKKPSIFTRKKPVSEKIAYNKEVLDNLNEILKENETRMLEVIEHFTYLKKLIAIYVYRLSNYISELENNIANFDNINQNKQQNIFESVDSSTIKKALCDKLDDYKISLNISIQQYHKIDLVLNNYLLNLSKTSTARNTTIPNLYIELSIRDSILLEQDSISDLNDINNLLNNIVKANNELLDRNTFKVDKNNKDNITNKNLGESIKNILINENLMNQNDNADTNIDKPLIKKINI